MEEYKKDNNVPMQEELGGGDLPDMDIPGTTMQTETLPMKRTILQSGGQCKKMKVHKGVPELTLTEDDAELVAEKVQDHATEAWDDAEKKREEIIKKLTEVKDTLEQLQLTTCNRKNRHNNKLLKKRSVPVQETSTDNINGE
jgi:hypothetical protein